MPDDIKDETKTTETDPKDESPKEDFSKLKTEKDNWRKKAQELEAQLKAKETNELKIKEDFKSLAEQREKEANEWKSKFETKLKEDEDNLKKTHVRREFRKHGVSDEVVDTLINLVNINDVKYDPETKSVWGHEEQVKAVKLKLPMAFGSGTPSPAQTPPALDPAKLDITKMAGKDIVKSDTLSAQWKAAGLDLPLK